MRNLAAAIALVVLVAGCDDQADGPDPVVVNVTEVVQRITEYVTVDIWHETETTIIEEDTTPDVVYVTNYEYPSGPVPCLVLETEGVPAMADGPVSSLPVTTTLGATDKLLVTQGGTSKQIEAQYARYAFPPNHIHGLITSPNATDYDADVDIAAGGCRDDGDADNMDLASSLTKRLDAAWSVGTNAGGLDTGSIAPSTLYAIWLIKRSDTGVVDALFSLSFTSPTMPTNYDEKRLIGAIKTDSTSDIIYYHQVGDYFEYAGDATTYLPLDVDDSTITNLTFELGTASAPPDCIANLVCNADNTTESADRGEVWVRSRARTTPPSALAGDEWIVGGQESSGAPFRRASGRALVALDSSSQFEYTARETAGTSRVRIYTVGFYMTTRRDP